MLEYDFLKIINQSIKSYREFPLPAIIVDREFRVYWSNDPAKNLFSHLTDTRGLAGILEEFDLEAVRRDLEEKGSCTIGDIIPLSGVRMSILPVYGEGEMAGMVLLLMGADTMLGVRDFYQSAKTATALSTGLQNAVNSVFGVMDSAAMKADIIEAGWVKSSYERISNYCYRILRISCNISMFSQYQGGHLDFSPKVLDLFSLLREWEETVGLLASSMGIPVQFHIPRKVACVSLDPSKFELVFFNVLHNALYFTRPGNQITVRAKKGETGTVLTVADKGVGIPKSVLPQVFRPYMAYDHADRRTTVGLGLTLCKIFMEAQGGGIFISSREGMGTTVTLTFQDNAFSQSTPLAQGKDRFALADRFSPVYTGLADATISPYRE